MPAIPLLRAKLAIHLTDRYMRIPLVNVFNPFKLDVSMSVGMWSDWSVRLISKVVFGAVESLVPTHQRSFGDMVSAADKINGAAAAVKVYRIESCFKSMWQISL